MSVMDICNDIGFELRNTLQGREALKTYFNLLEELNDDEKDLFLMSSHRVQWGIHFYVTEAVVDLLKLNIDNQYLGKNVQSILSNQYIEESIKTMHQLGDFISKISLSAFQINVQYTLPSEVRATPKLIRLVQDLSVECQKTKVLQEIIIKSKSFNFQNLLKDFDQVRSGIIAPPYSKKDRVVIKKLCALGYNKKNVELIYSFNNILAMIKQTIYDSFMDRIYYINVNTDILSMREKQVGKLKVIKIRLKPTTKSIQEKHRWIMKIEKENGSIMYGQIFSKHKSFEQDNIELTLDAIIYAAL